MEPASIRTMNPGAMWGRTGKRPGPEKEVATNNPLALKWGSTRTIYLSDGLNQGNNIAIFPTYVQGICAQLDLWRSSPHYRNKKFADAINTWDGGNYTESYIKFVLARVPGMTRTTIMNDDFWKSPMGPKFLKAQAGHEAGKAYPAPDSDFVEAQRRVFSTGTMGAAPAKAELHPDDRPGLSSKGDARLYDNQVQLKHMNYNPGMIDGVWGGGTAGAIAAFFNDYAPDATAPLKWQDYDKNYKAIDSTIDKAESEGFIRPVTKARDQADPDVVKSVAPEIAPAQHSKWAAITTFFSALGGSIYSCVDWLMGYKDQAEQWGLFGYINKVPTFVWLLLIAAVTGVVVFKAVQTVNGITKPVQNGERM